VVAYVDLPFGWGADDHYLEKHRLVCPNEECTQRTLTLFDHRMAGVGCVLTTGAAKRVVKQIGAGQTISHWPVSSAAAGTYPLSSADVLFGP
jgi:hypothetical protein